MNRNEARSQYLKLMAKLYEVASQFDERTLREINHIAEEENNKPVLRSVQGLMLLSSDHKGGGAIRKRTRPPQTLNQSNVGSFYDFFASREIFPTSNDVLTSLPFHFDLKPKESRERLARRLVTYIDSLPDDERKSVLSSVQSAVSNQHGGSFVTNWSKLIRGL